jgi:hypothetical protein
MKLKLNLLCEKTLKQNHFLVDTSYNIRAGFMAGEAKELEGKFN